MFTEALLVPGLAAEPRRTSAFKILKAMLADGANIRSRFIDGVTRDNGVLRATLPSEQEAAIIDRLQPGTVIIAQSLGGLSAVNALLSEEATEGVRAFLIAPPVPRPLSVLRHKQIRGRCIKDEDGNVIMSTYSHPGGVLVTPEYFAEVRSANAGFDKKLRALTDLGIAQVVAPTKDWNTAYDATTYNSTVPVEATHSLAGGGNYELLIACRDIWRAIEESIQEPVAPAPAIATA